jgi:PAS domain S-box-containing protein
MNIGNPDNKLAAETLCQKAEELLNKRPKRTTPQISSTDILKLLNELDVYQVELGMQNEELHRALSAAQDAIEVYDFAPIGYFTISKVGDVLGVNLHGARMLGKDRNHLINSRFGFFVSDDDKPSFSRFLERIFNSKVEESCEITILTDNKLSLFVIITGIISNNGEQCMLTLFDITDRKKAEDAWKKSELELRLLAESMPQIVWITEPDGMNIYFNHQWVEYTGLSLEESYGHGWNKPFHPDDQQRAWIAWQNATQHGATYSLECRLCRADGEYQWWLIRGVPVLDANGTIIKWFGTCTDIEELKQKERELFQTKAILQGAMDQSLAGIAIADAPDGKLRYVNDAGLLIRGGNRQHVVDSVGIDQYVASWKLLDLDGTPLKPDEVPLARAIMFGETNSREFIIRREVDDDRIVLAKAAPIKDETGKVVSGIVVFLDITENKHAENEIRNLNETLEKRIADRTEQLVIINKELNFHLSELEQFSYVSNHDLQEPLRTLIQFTQLIKENYSGKLDEDGNKYIDFISNSAVRMKAMVKDLLEYSLLGKEGVKTSIDCNRMIDDVLNDMGDTIKESSAKIAVESLPMVNGHATELRLLFQNLVSNAIKYQKQGSVPEINISAESHNNEWLFKVSDNGIGIEPKHNEKIFIIFQRLHKRNEFSGTGIGLAHCKKVVELHGGKIWVESTPGEGSNFMFTIPKNNHK